MNPIDLEYVDVTSMTMQILLSIHYNYSEKEVDVIPAND